MKIAGCIFQNKLITYYTLSKFEAIYKGKRFYITTDHGFGQPKENYLKRYLIDVVDIKTGMYDCQAYEDLETINEAISWALNGAMLTKNK